MVRRMRKIMLGVLAVAFAAPAQAAERRFPVTDFDRVQVDGPYKVSLTTGRSPSVVATGSAQAIDSVSMEVQGRTLRIRPNRSAWGGYPGADKGPLTIRLSAHGLRAAMLNGSGSLEIDKARAPRFDLTLAGSGELNIGAIETDVLTLAMAGSGKLGIGGKAKTLRARILGSGNVEAEGLTATDAQITSETSGTVVIGVSRAAKVTSAGAGDVSIIGAPACTVSALGAGRVACGKK